jgi:hypothetical protein
VAKPTDLPALVGEFVEMSKEYLRQETLEPAKQLGRFAGYSVAAAFAFSIGTLFLSIAGMRWLVSALPKGAYWEGLGYVLVSLVLAGVTGLVALVGKRRSDEGLKA